MIITGFKKAIEAKNIKSILKLGVLLKNSSIWMLWRCLRRDICARLVGETGTENSHDSCFGSPFHSISPSLSGPVLSKHSHLMVLYIQLLNKTCCKYRLWSKSKRQLKNRQVSSCPFCLHSGVWWRQLMCIWKETRLQREICLKTKTQCSGWFCVSSWQRLESSEKGTSVEEMPLWVLKIRNSLY